MTIAQKLLNDINHDPGWFRITGSEIWECGYDIETKKPKVLLMFSFITIVYQRFLPDGRTVNKEYYIEIVPRLRSTIMH